MRPCCIHGPQLHLGHYTGKQQYLCGHGVITRLQPSWVLLVLLLLLLLLLFGDKEPHLDELVTRVGHFSYHALVEKVLINQ